MCVHIHADWETRSAVDIKSAGADVYAEHPSTDILTLSYAIGDGDVRRWRPGLPLPEDLFLELAMGGKLVAHNAYFELVIWKHIAVPRYGFPPLTVDQTIDTMAIAYAHGLPGSLDGASKAVGLAVQKDEAGRRIMLRLCKPRGWDGDTPLWHEREDNPDLFAALDAYCDNDVVVERALEKKLPALKASEQRIWELDFTINQRGVPIDVDAARRALGVIDEEADALNAELRQITGGIVPKATNAAKFVVWLRDVKGLPATSLAKAAVRDLLDLDLSPDVRRALEIRGQVGKTSTKKLTAMLACTSSDGRARGLHQFHSAATGRWGGRRIQTQNMPRPAKGVDIEWCLNTLLELEQPEAFAAIDMVYGGATAALSSCLRSMIKAPKGKRFITADFSNVEGRVLPWLAGEASKLAIFAAIDAGEGKDVYLVAASGIFGEEITDKEDPRRQVGKVSELALGFQGGAGAFDNMAKVYDVDVAGILPFIWPVSPMRRKKEALRSWWQRGRVCPDMGMSRAAWVAAELVKMPWRERHPAVVQYWRDIEDAAVAAVRRPGIVTYAGRVRFRKAGSFLFMQLPSKRCLAYPFPKLLRRPMPWRDANGQPVFKDVLTFFSKIDESKKAKIVPDPNNSGKWARVATYGGELTENSVQAVARDLLAEAMLRLEARGYPVVMHVHDEAVCELPEGEGSLAEVCAIMAEVPAWAEGLPMAAAGWEGVRYRK